MLPTLIIAGRTLPTYGILAMVGLVLAVVYLWLTSPGRRGMEADVELALVWCMVGTFLGAKLLYLAVNGVSLFADLPYAFSRKENFFQKYFSGGFVYYGGLYGALITVWIYGKRNHCSLEMLVRRLLPVVPLIHAFGRLGCFCTGCCYGKPASWGIAFTASLAAPNGIALIPVQLFEAGFEILMFVLTAFFAGKKVSGRRILTFYLLAYGVFRFFAEFFRGDEARGFLLGMSTSQLISVITVAFVLWVFYHRRKQPAL